MKLLVVLLGFLALTSANSVAEYKHLRSPRAQELLKDIFMNHEKLNATRQLTATINEYMDVLFDEAGQFISDNGYEPIDLPDMVKSFSKKFLLITYHGEISLKKGRLNDLSSIRRSGDCTLRYDSLFLHVTVPMSFKVLLADYRYKAKFMNLGPSGGVEAKVKTIKIYTDVLIDLKALQLYLQDFNIEKINDIDVKFTGNILVDWMVNLLSDVVTLLFKGVIKNILNDKVSSTIETVIDVINQDLQNTFG